VIARPVRASRQHYDRGRGPTPCRGVAQPAAIRRPASAATSDPYTAGMLRTVMATRYVTPFREGGSLPGLCEADDDGLYVVKFHGAGQGPKALVAEVIAGELGRALGILVPEQVLVELDPALGAAEAHWRSRSSWTARPGRTSASTSFPARWRTRRPSGPGRILPSGRDRLVRRARHEPGSKRPEREPADWHGRVYCIDHGAALFAHHRWEDPAAQARRPFPWIADHVLLRSRRRSRRRTPRLASLVTPRLLEGIVAEVPDVWLAGDPRSPPSPRTGPPT